MLAYHGTSENNYNKIVNEGFKLLSFNGIWGNGIYLTNDINEAENYGNSILKTDINDNDILTIHYESGINEYIKDLSIYDEEGSPELRDIVLNKGFKGVSIQYEDTTNLIIYDLTAINNIL